MTTLAEVRAAALAAYELIESVAWDAPVFEDETVSPAHAKLESLLYGDDALPVDGVIVTPDSLVAAMPTTEVEWAPFWHRVDDPDGWVVSIYGHKLAAAIIAALAAEDGPA